VVVEVVDRVSGEGILGRFRVWEGGSRRGALSCRRFSFL
jgi:hypothetical protein